MHATDGQGGAIADGSGATRETLGAVRRVEEANTWRVVLSIVAAACAGIVILVATLPVSLLRSLLPLWTAKLKLALPR